MNQPSAPIRYQSITKAIKHLKPYSLAITTMMKLLSCLAVLLLAICAVSGQTADALNSTSFTNVTVGEGNATANATASSNSTSIFIGDDIFSTNVTMGGNEAILNATTLGSTDSTSISTSTVGDGDASSSNSAVLDIPEVSGVNGASITITTGTGDNLCQMCTETTACTDGECTVTKELECTEC